MMIAFATLRLGILFTATSQDQVEAKSGVRYDDRPTAFFFVHIST